jgi:glycosyltransferase involved in cell wall biosynthesis
MRILRVAQKVYPDVAGGGAYHVHALSRDQAAAGHEVTVLTVDHDGAGPHVEDRTGYTMIRYPPTVEPLGNAVSVGLARHLRRTDGHDVVHAHSHLYFSTNLAAAARRLGGSEPPLAVTNHGLHSQTAPARLFEPYLRTLGRWTFDAADLVFCYTAADRARLRDLGVSSPVAVVANGVDTDRFSPAGLRHGAVDGEPAVLFVGRLVPGKRPADAIDAFERVLETHPDAGLTIVGDGALRAELERRVASAGLGDAVAFLGHVDYDDMPAVYLAADVLVLPSETEGFPRTILEALASGTPVVASALEQLAPLAGHGVSLVPVGDVSGFASAIDGLVTGSGRVGAGDGDVAGGDVGESAAGGGDVGGGSGRALVETRFDWADAVAQSTAHLAALVE